jgi:nucleoside-triphosphatase THEP1
MLDIRYKVSMGGIDTREERDMEKFTGQILLITGPRGSGKTTLCRRVIEVARQASWQVRGLLSPPIIKGSLKLGIGVEDLSSTKRFMLARLPDETDTGTEIQTDSWVFDSRCLSWGNTILEQSLPTDLLVIDELGPLEIERNQGWTAAFPVVESGQFHLALVVVREELLNTLLKRWPRASTIAVSSTERIDRLVEKIIEKLADLQGLIGGEI